ncbi:MAG: sulfatase-like hydrolase/transferase [Psychrosphaera sp.]|nr:sulfatase-like hydrolase/transferase [Psychrosphaera sp.]
MKSVTAFLKTIRARCCYQPFLLAIFLSTSFAARSENILLVIADDLGLDYFEQMCPQFYASSTDETISPTIKELCKRAVFFSNAWAYTVCSPTRASMLTGRYGFRNGVTQVQGDLLQSVIESNEMTIPKVLDAVNSGYAHANIGKWHLQSSIVDGEYPVEMGWQYYYGLLSGMVSNYSNWQATEATRLLDDTIDVSKLLETQTEYITTNVSTRAQQWLDEKNTAQQPWLLWLAYTAPHSPFHKPPAELLTGSIFADLPESGASDAEYYQAMIYAMDAQLAKVLESVDMSDTFIVFMGDNGSPGDVVADELVGKSKGSVYEGGLRVPLIIIPPNNGEYSGTKQVDDLIHSVDIFPTLLEMAGQDMNQLKTVGAPLEHIDIDGKSLLGYLTDSDLTSAPDARTSLYNEVSPAQEDGARTARNKYFKLIKHNSGDESFYSLNCKMAEADCVNTFLPIETTNWLADTLPQELTSKRMRAYKTLSDHLDQMEQISTCEAGVTDPVNAECGSLY